LSSIKKFLFSILDFNISINKQQKETKRMSGVQFAKVATCNLNQWALDFEGNLERILESLRVAKALGCRYRLGPELEISGYGCEDHFFENDTLEHSWEVLGELLKSDATDDLLSDIGMALLHRGVRYNCRVYVLNRRILFIRPKLFLAAEGNYRENRWFQAWVRDRELDTFVLPEIVVEAMSSSLSTHGEVARTVPIGDGVLELLDTVVGTETCEELFTPNAPHVALGLSGVEIIGNGSGSHHQLRKLDKRVHLMQSATDKVGGVYLYSNQKGCDGGRLYFDGSSMIWQNGQLLSQAPQFSMQDVEVITAVVNLDEVRSYRASVSSRMYQAASIRPFPRIKVNFNITTPSVSFLNSPLTTCKEVHYHLPEEEIAYGPACWLWDFLRRSNLGGFFLPLSGGADSSATAAIVGSMCQMIVKECKAGNQRVIEDVRKVTRHSDPNWIPEDAKELANRIFVTCYMSTVNSSQETRDRSQKLSAEIGGYHLNAPIDGIVSAFVKLFTLLTNKEPKFRVHGGSVAENLALQNIQARTRMVVAYLLAQLTQWSRGYQSSLLVLGSANVDEALRGYLTKYDCSSADLNPIGAISKTDLKSFLRWAALPISLGYPVLADVVAAPPTAELEPITETYTQTDEADMGMSYDELSVFGRLRKISLCGPVGMYQRLVSLWGAPAPDSEAPLPSSTNINQPTVLGRDLSPQAVAEKVKRFFFFYSINRHKLTVLTPSYHAESYSPEDNRYDLRQFLYNARWTWQFRRIDALVARASASAALTTPSS
jgi:NAD+ synthase (glutamine-hydrolysing)